MFRFLSLLALLAVPAALVCSARPAAAGFRYLSAPQDSLPPTENPPCGGGWHTLFSDPGAQSFTPTTSYAACRIEINGSFGQGTTTTLTLSLRSSSSFSAPSIRSKTITFSDWTPPNSPAWVGVDFPAVWLHAGTRYYIHANAAFGPGNFGWNLTGYNGSSLPYPGERWYTSKQGQLFDSDHAAGCFRVFRVTKYVAVRDSPRVVIDTSPALAPGVSSAAQVLTPATMLLTKGAVQQHVALRRASMQIAIGANAEPAGSQSYPATISALNGTFEPYSWDGAGIDSSRVTSDGPASGTIDFAAGSVTFSIPVMVESTGYPSIHAVIAGSGQLTAPNQIDVESTSTGGEAIATRDLPGSGRLAAWGLGLLLALTSVWALRARREAPLARRG